MNKKDEEILTILDNTIQGEYIIKLIQIKPNYLLLAMDKARTISELKDKLRKEIAYKEISVAKVNGEDKYIYLTSINYHKQMLRYLSINY